MWTRLKSWLLSIISEALAEERKITSALVSSVHGDVALVGLHIKKDLASLKADILAEMMKPEHFEKAIVAAIESEISKLHASASHAAHTAVHDIRQGVGRKRCELCQKVVDAWKLVEGKVECADCAIRKAL